MSAQTPPRHSRYPDLAVALQIVRDAPLFTLVLACDARRLRPHIPAPLAPHPAGRLILNMWAHKSPQATTGFGAPGPIGVSYLAAEVAGPEGASADGALRFPGRIWLAH